MYRLLTLFLLVAIAAPLSAQQRFSDRIVWEGDPTAVDWSGRRYYQFTYRVEPQSGADAGDASASPVLSRDAANGTVSQPRTTKRQPLYQRSFPARPGRTYAVEVRDIRWEPVNLPSGAAAELPTDFAFVTATSRQPGGYRGKFTAPALIRTAAGPQRLVSIDLAITSQAGTRASRRMNWAANSVLRSGEWFRFTVKSSGVHKLTRAFLTDELGVNLDGVDPRDLAVFGQTRSGKLPETNNVEPPDDLTELPVTIEGGGDGSFDGGDFILFHALGPDRETYDATADRFRYEKNIYATTNSYFLRVGGGRGRRIGDLATTTGGTEVTTYDAFYHFEEDRFNILHELSGNSHGSGQSWWGEFFKISREKDYRNLFQVPDFVPGQAATVRARMALRTDVSSTFALEMAGQRAQSRAASRVRFGAQEQSSAAFPIELAAAIPLTSANVDIKIDYPQPGNSESSEAYLDWIQLRAPRRLTLAGRDQFRFRDTRATAGSNRRYVLGDAATTTRVWRLDGADVRRASLNGGAFSAAGDPNVSYVAFNPGAGLLQPTAVGRVENQDLHALTSAQLIIVTHPNFVDQAEELAEHRREHNGLETVVVTTRQVYNEFSSGRDDPAALRNFGRMLYERSPDLRYLLLFGDGSFDHRDVYELGTNFVPVYEHDGRLTEVGSFPADDFFGIYGEAQNGQPLEPDLNVAVGRLPVKTADEATQVVAKLKRYDVDPRTLGDWRTRMVFVGDDEDFNQHARDVNRVSQTVAELKPDLNFDKLYFDLFPQQSLSAGDRYPAITEGLDRAIFRGALAVTYLGHGGPRGWAQERVLTIPQIRNWTRPANSADPIQPPVFITATCTFSNYDDAGFVSAGEEALLTPNGGAAALLTTTRPVFATRNFILTDETVRAMLERPDGEWRTLGDVIRIAKNNVTAGNNNQSLSGITENARKFTLLGDPAMVIAFPEHAVVTTRIDDQPLDAARQDTVRALQRMKISGEVTDLQGNRLEDFNGLVYPTIYDKPVTVTTLQQDEPSVNPLQVEVQRNIVFRGRATVTGGRFTFEFVVPQDINYEFGAGKISYYAADPTRFTDAAGFYDKLVIGGTSTDAVADDQGPEVEVFMDTEDFVSGSQTSEDPVLLVKLADDLGINVTGNSIGHDLEAVLDEDTRNSIVLNDYYEAEADDFRRGTVRYPLFDIEPGLHSVTVRAWDVANNSAQGRTEFLVAADGADAISRVLNYPNPFTDRTCFQFDHTVVGEEVDVLIQIYTVSGRLVKTLQGFLPFSDGTVRQDDCIEWDGLDDYGDQLARGVYLYQVRLRGSEGTVVNGELEKLVILK